MLECRTGKSYWIGAVIGVKYRRCRKTPNTLTGEGGSACYCLMAGLTHLSGQILSWGYKLLLTLAWAMGTECLGESNDDMI